MSDTERVGATRTRRWIWAAVATAVVGAVVVVVAVGVSGSPPARSASTPTAAASPGTGGADGAPTPPIPPAGAAPEDVESTVAPELSEPGPRSTSEPVPLDRAANPSPDVSVSLESLEAFEGQAAVPGEVAGPALRIAVAVRNDGTSALPTGTLVVNLFYGPDRTPANILVSPRENLPDEIAAGDTARGVFAFTVPADARADLLVEVDVDVHSSVVLFEGGI